MAVPKGKRGTSKMDFFFRAYRLQEAITKVLIRDFGVKSISRDLKTFTRNARMADDDRKTFVGLCEKYKIDIEAEYPLWLIEHYRDWILRLLREMINNITVANTIYPSGPEFVHWHNMRKQYQQMAIANCYQILQALQAAGRILPVNYEKFLPYVDIINEEITALKNWRKAGNKMLKAYQESLEKDKAKQGSK